MTAERFDPRQWLRENVEAQSLPLTPPNAPNLPNPQPENVAERPGLGGLGGLGGGTDRGCTSHSVAIPLPDDQCDAPSIQAEPPPAPADDGMRAGLMAVATIRPPSWVNPYPHNPTQGSACFCCGNRRWWSRDRMGWCCWTCHPPPLPLPSGWRAAEVVT